MQIDQIEAMKTKFYALDVKKTNVLDLEEMKIDHNLTENEITEKSLGFASSLEESEVNESS